MSARRSVQFLLTLLCWWLAFTVVGGLPVALFVGPQLLWGVALAVALLVTTLLTRRALDQGRRYGWRALVGLGLALSALSVAAILNIEAWLEALAWAPLLALGLALVVLAICRMLPKAATRGETGG